MTQIPKVGSEWIRCGEKAKVVFADDRSVLLEDDDGSRWHFCADLFEGHFQPAPRTVTHRRWVNLYADGMMIDFADESTASLEKGVHYNARLFVETRLIEWTVEE